MVGKERLVENVAAPFKFLNDYQAAVGKMAEVPGHRFSKISMEWMNKLGRKMKTEETN
jgi:hypothetical protein